MTRNSLPFGDAFIVQTPELQRASNLLYQQDQQRRQQMVQYGSTMDNEMMKQLGNVKNIDIPDITNAWGEYKQAKQNLLFNRSIQRDPNAYAQAQIAANEKLGNVMKLVNASKENKDFLTNVRKDMETHPHEYDDDTAPAEWSRQMNTKTGDLKNAGDVTPFRWGGPKTDFSKISKAAAGSTPRKFSGEPKPYSADQTETPQYEAGATPGQFYQSFVGSLSNHDAGKDATKLWGTIPQATIDAVNKQYDSIAPETMKLWTGSEKAPLPEPSTDAEKFAQFNTKLYAINNLPKSLVSHFTTNSEAKLKLQNDLTLARSLRLQAVRHADTQSNIQLRSTFKTPKEQSDVLDEYMQDLKSDAGINDNTGSAWEAGKTYNIAADDRTRHVFADPNIDGTGKPLQPTEMSFLPATKEVKLTYEYTNTKGENQKVETTIPEKTFKIRTGNDMFGKKITTQSIENEQNKKPKVSTLPHGSLDDIH